MQREHIALCFSIIKLTSKSVKILNNDFIGQTITLGYTPSQANEAPERTGFFGFHVRAFNMIVGS